MEVMCWSVGSIVDGVHASARRRRDADRAAGQGVLRQLRLLKVRGVRVLPGGIFAIGTKNGSAGPWQPLRPTATPSVDSAYPAACKTWSAFLSLIALNQHT